MHALVIAELAIPAGTSDKVPFRAVESHVHHTWARTFSSMPELYIQPETLKEVEKAVNLARACRRRIVTTGCGHSPSSITCTSSWMVNLDRFNRILSIDATSGIVVMQSGIRLHHLCDFLAKHGLAMPNLGSINQQSIAGAISTGTHGSSARHGLISENVLALKITLADGKTVTCSPGERPELFKAALLSLGALGIITEVTFKAVPEFTLRWSQVIDADSKMLSAWNKTLWAQSEFVRVWWLPYTRRAVVWEASKTEDSVQDPPMSWQDGLLGYYLYHNLLYLGQYAPRLLPWIEWFFFGLQYGFPNGSKTSAAQPSRKALLMNCLYSQFVNEWALPLDKGPLALRRLSSWLNHLDESDPDYVPHDIPFSADGLYVHAPIEVRVSDTTITSNSRPFLDPTNKNGPTVYLNATLYRPYWQDPPCHKRYYQAFEWLMRDMGGRPHWAKNFESTAEQLTDMYDDDFASFRKVRDEADPEGMFVGPWHREKLLGGDDEEPMMLEEIERERLRALDNSIVMFGSLVS